MDNPKKLAMQVTRRKQTKQKHNSISVGHHHTQTNTTNVNKTWALLQKYVRHELPLHKSGGKDEPNIVVCGNRDGHHNTHKQTQLT
jgi:hypothetical protein